MLCCLWDLCFQQNVGIVVLVLVKIVICQGRSVEAYESEIGTI
jgi:hypothetical protein